jgi:hypothetical protein
MDIKTEFITSETARDTEVVTCHRSNNVATYYGSFFQNLSKRIAESKFFREQIN